MVDGVVSGPSPQPGNIVHVSHIKSTETNLNVWKRDGGWVVRAIRAEIVSEVLVAVLQSAVSSEVVRWVVKAQPAAHHSRMRV